MPGPWVSDYLCRNRDNLPSNPIHRPCQAAARHREPCLEVCIQTVTIQPQLSDQQSSLTYQ